ncbi:MAG: hypothetical protein KOO60_07215, partial [Gemmatimonadales bacterium]|nr:hypothetical protein [Gemmatimonadales bacterium]
IGPWGSGAVVNGQFQDQGGVPDWNGWTSRDLTQNSEVIWHVDTYNVVSGVYSAWCGDMSYSACTSEDPVGGYGASYNEYLSWYGTVGNVNVATTVEITATVNHNTEPGYDFSNLGYYKGDNNIAYLWTADGEGEQVAVTGLVTYQPGEYVAHPDGGAENQVHITWHVTSDGGWDDSDCSYYGDGALQIDDITVTLNNDGGETSTVDDFEDNTLGNWVVEFPQGVGDYAHLRCRLSDEDPCANNYSPQVCFIADDIMLAERGLPVAYCIDWCYGPGGYIVSTTGGAAGPIHGIHNAVESPIISWPAGDYQGLSFLFDVYRHEDMSADAPGIFYTWGVRSTASANPEDIKQEYFADRNFIYYGGPDYFRGGDANVTDLVVSGRTHVQVQLAVYELYTWAWNGDDGYPAPYFDNVSLICYEHFGPS